MCGVGGMSLPSIFFFLQMFFFFFGLLAVCGKRHGLGSLTFCFLLVCSRSSTNRPSAHRATARHRQGPQKPPIALAVPAAPPTTTAAVAPPCPRTALPRVLRAPGHLDAHPRRLWRRRALFAEPVLLHVCQSGETGRRHGVALDEGALCLFFLRRHHCSSYRPCLASPLFTLFFPASLGWQNAVYHGIGRLVTLSPQGLGE